MKRSLDGYQPLQTRREAGKQQEGKEAASVKRVAPPATGRVFKPKRAAPKRIHSDAWHSDADESEASDSLTDDSAASRRASARLSRALSQPHGELQQPAVLALTAERGPSGRSAAAVGKLKLSYITSQSQLEELPLGAAHFSSIAGAFFASSLRLKPRKPVAVTVSAVW